MKGEYCVYLIHFSHRLCSTTLKFIIELQINMKNKYENTVLREQVSTSLGRIPKMSLTRNEINIMQQMYGINYEK